MILDIILNKVPETGIVTKEIITLIITTAVTAIAGFFAKNKIDKKRADTSDIKLAETINKKEIIKSARLDNFQNSIEKMQISVEKMGQEVEKLEDVSVHEIFTRNFIVNLNKESQEYIKIFGKLDTELLKFINFGAKETIKVFYNILFYGFENFDKDVLKSEFSNSEESIRSRFGRNNNLDRKKIQRVLTSEIINYSFEVEKIIKENKNGVRRKKFEEFCTETLKSIIKKIIT